MTITLTYFLHAALSEKQSSQNKAGQGLGLSRLDEISQYWAQGKNNLPSASVRVPMQHFFSCACWAWKRLEILPCKLAIAQLTRQLNQQSNQWVWCVWTYQRAQDPWKSGHIPAPRVTSKNMNKKHSSWRKIVCYLHANETISSTWALRQSLEPKHSLDHMRKEQVLPIYLAIYWLVSCMVQ